MSNPGRNDSYNRVKSNETRNRNTYSVSSEIDRSRKVSTIQMSEVSMTPRFLVWITG